jgi:hypothetical protein
MSFSVAMSSSSSNCETTSKASEQARIMKERLETHHQIPAALVVEIEFRWRNVQSHLGVLDAVHLQETRRNRERSQALVPIPR